MFVMATRSDLPFFKFPAATHSRSVLVRSQESGEYWDARGLPRPKRLTIFPKDLGDARTTLASWVTVRDAISGLQKPALSEKQASMNHWIIPGARVYAGHSGSTLDWPSKTIKAGVHGVPGGENVLVEPSGSVRYFTLRELARLQTFPDEHLFSGPRMSVTRQLGNAVPCALASAIARPLYELLHVHLKSERGIHAAAAVARV
jgi:DNA (cytosine-5)-methyltransferase 1